MVLYVKRGAKGEVGLSADAPAAKRPSRKELAEAYAWWCIELLEDGVVADQAELAQALGVTRARVTQALATLSS